MLCIYIYIYKYFILLSRMEISSVCSSTVAWPRAIRYDSNIIIIIMCSISMIIIMVMIIRSSSSSSSSSSKASSGSSSGLLIDGRLAGFNISISESADGISF